MTKKAMRLIKKKYNTYQRFLASKTGHDYQKYLTDRNESSREVKHAKREYEKRISDGCKQNTKYFWKYVQETTKRKSGISTLKMNSGEMAETDSQKADTLNQFFASVFTRENLNDIPKLPECSRSKGVSLNQDIDVTAQTVEKKLKELNANKAQGPDLIPPRVLKELSKELSIPLSKLYNKSIETGKIPGDWKSAEVTAIFKKGTRSEPGNYRPVSLTCIACKVLESCVRDAIVSHFTENKLYADCQHGFRKKRSCVTQLLLVMEEFSDMMDKGQDIDVVYLDFKKAFDSVPHERLLQKLAAYGICGETHRWIRDFLSGRVQRVKVGTKYSNEAQVLSGIPQGSILGPVLFTIFINDLPDTIEGTCKIFADDTKLYGPTEDSDIIQRDIYKLQEWSDRWNLYFNVTKCKVMHIGKSNPEREYVMKLDNADQMLDVCTEEKDLGVTFDRLLNFDLHVNKAIFKGNQMIGLIRRTFTYLTRDTFLKLYKALVRPHLEYGNTVWHPQFIRQSAAIERVQRRATKLLDECADMSYPERLRYLNLHSLKGRRIRGDLIEIYKIFSEFVDMEVGELFRLPEYTKTRNSDRKIYKEHWNKKIRKCSLRYRNTNHWNSLTNTMKFAVNTNNFKNLIDGMPKFRELFMEFDGY